jgi:hypothetical protein
VSALAQYDFFSYARRGAAALIDAPDPLTGPLPSLRAHLPIEVDVGFSATTTKDATAAMTVELYGPGDVLGFAPGHVVRTEPSDGALNFEPNYFAAIEFSDPDFPWLFTPLSAGSATGAGDPPEDRAGLRPWLALLVLADGEWTAYQSPPTGVKAITVTSAAALPNLDDSWAWAHMQVSGGVGSGDPGQALSSLLSTEPGTVTSRIICPRQLQPDTHYSAFVVPTFEAGRLAGGLDSSAAPAGDGYAWDSTKTSVDLPVYYAPTNGLAAFAFTTGDGGDFESLARALTPRPLPADVGIRAMDVSAPGWGLPPATSAPDPPTLGLSGALRSPATQDTPWTTETPFRPDLTQLLNAGAGPITDPSSDPVVVPPIWGHWHAAESTVDWQGAGWLDELNTDPRTRAMAGLGGEVVRAQRSQILASAWAQVAGIEQANQLLRQAQVARSAGSAVLTNHLAPANDELALSLTAPVHSRILAGKQTVFSTIAASSLPVRTLSPAFQRIARPLGPLRRRQGAAATQFADLLTRLNDRMISPVPPLHPPDGMVSLDQVAAEGMPSWIPAPLQGAARWLWLIVVVVAAALVAGVIAIAGLLGLLAAAHLLGTRVLIGYLILAAAAVGAIVALTVVLLRLLARARPAIVAASGLRFDALTPQAIASIPPRPGFQVSQRHQDPPPVPAGAQGPDSAEAANFRRAVGAAAQTFVQAPFDPPAPPPAPLSDLRSVVTTGLDPETTIPARIGGIITVGPTLGWSPADPLEPVLAAPEFDGPMYEPLRDLSQDYLLPGLSDVPPDTVSLLEQNHEFIEAYMVGLNHELGRQLLFAGYPTDQRPSSFRQFWDPRGYVPQPGDPTDPQQLAESLKDIPPIVDWVRQTDTGPELTELGDNAIRPVDPANPDVVLLVRGELLRRYPNAQIYAAQASWQDGHHVLPNGPTELHPLYRGTLSPDVTFVGFQLTVEAAKGTPDGSEPGWYFVIRQQPTEPRFGLEPAPSPYTQPPINAWNDISWASFAADAAALAALAFAPVDAQPANLSGLADGPDNPDDTENGWGQDAAQTAYITFRRPVLVAIHASAMLP